MEGRSAARAREGGYEQVIINKITIAIDAKPEFKLRGSKAELLSLILAIRQERIQKMIRIIMMTF